MLVLSPDPCAPGDGGDPAAPLSDVTFVVVDLETTGTDPRQNRIIEVGAAKFRSGECRGTFQTFVNPGCGIPPFIEVLTGITEDLVFPAPEIGEVLPTLLEFIGDTVLVGHNLRFDTSFLDAALTATDRPALEQRRVDTLALARRLVKDEVPNLKLGSLATLFRAEVTPTHRALDDVLATADVFHGLLERLGSLGVTGLDDLLELPAGPLALAKLPLLADLPRRPGAFLLRDWGGRVLYAGSAANLRREVRSLLPVNSRRKLTRLMTETAAIDHVPCASAAEAELEALRLVAAHQPRYNKRRKRRRLELPPEMQARAA